MRTLNSQFITKIELKNEFIEDGLRKIPVDFMPHYSDKEKVNRFLQSNIRINVSNTRELE